MATKPDYYAVLKVDAEASPDEIRHAFRERVRACHPDRVANLDDDLRALAEKKMVQLNEAYAVLRNPARRAAYDDQLIRTHAPAALTPSPSVPRREPSPPPVDEHVSREQFAGREFVSRAACEEFETRSDYYFVLAAPPKLDEKGLRRFLRQLKSWSSKLDTRWWRRVRALGFLGAVEFSHRERLCQIVEQFNQQTLDDAPLGPVTMVDLVNWQVFPGQGDLDTRLSSLLRD